MADDEHVVRPGTGILAEVEVTGLDSDGDARRFTYTDRLGQESEGFIMRWRAGFVAYENRCPHWSIPIGYEDEEFLDHAGLDIYCPMHGARFDTDTGLCIEGPCYGDRLEKFKITEVNPTTVAVARVGLKLF